MVLSQEEILLTIGARDNASNVAGNVDKSFQGMASNISQALSSLNSSMMNFGQVSDNIMQGLSGKSAMDNILGTTTKAETNSVLIKMMTESEEAAQSLNKTVDEVTDKSLTSMQDLIPAMNAFKSATGASDKELESITDEMANFGAAVLAQTGSTDLAQQSMMDLSKGIKGAFASLDQYGVSEEALMRTGLWSGKEDDVKGYMAAVNEVIGSTDELMKTNQGLDALIGKAFSRAGKKIGNDFLPFLKDIKKGFLELDDSLGGGLTATILAVSSGIEIANQAFWNLSTTINGIKDLKNAGRTVIKMVKDYKKAKQITEGLETAGEIGGAVGNAGEKISKSSKGVETASKSTSVLSGSLTSMIAPLLKLSAVIIIMIPVVSVIAAEGMIFVKLLGELMKGLKFDGINLKDSINGIKQIAEGIAWIGVALGTITFTALMTNISILISGITGFLFGGLDVAVAILKQVNSKLNELGNLKINKDTVGKLKSLSDGLNSMAQAISSLTKIGIEQIKLNISNFVATITSLGHVTDSLDTAKTELINAGKAINELGTGITPIDEGKAQNIQNVCNSLASVGEAIGALRKLRDDYNWDFTMGSIFKGVDIQTALETVKTDITKASNALAQFTGLATIPEGVAQKIQTTASTLKSVGESFNTLRSLRDNFNWDEMMGGIFKGQDISGALDKVISDIKTVATKLMNLGDMSPVNSDIQTKIHGVASGLQKLKDAVPVFKDFPTSEGFNIANVQTAVNNIKQIATQLSTLSNITLTEGSTGILGTINSALTTLKSTLANATGFSDSAIHIGSEIVNGVKSGLAPLPSTVTTQVSTATNSAASAGWTGGAHIGTSVTNGFKSSLQLANVMTTEMGHVKSAVDSGISAAKSAAENGAKEIVQAFQNGVNVGSPGDIARTMKQEMLYTKDFIVGAGPGLMSASYSLAKNIVKSFGNPSLNPNFLGSSLSLNNLATVVTSPSASGSINKIINIYVSESAVNIDARNKTEKEAKQLGIAILESFDGITDINVAGD